MLVLSVFTICTALLVPMFGKPGSPVTPANDGILWTSKPEVIDGSDEAHKTLSIAVSMDEDEYEYWVKQNDLFERSHPEISISMTNIRGKDADAARKQASEAGAPYDMMLLDNDRVREFAVQGLLLPADEVVTGDAAADQLEALTSIVKWNGSLWGVPLDSDPLLVVWQKELLKAGGLSVPPVNLQALHNVLEQLVTTMPEAAVSPFNLNTADATQLIAWLGMFRENGEPAGNLSAFNLSEKQQLRYTAEREGTIYRLDPEQQKVQLMAAFESGKLLSAVMPWSVYQSLSNDQRNLLLIGTQKGPLVRTNGRSFVLMAETEKLAEAREYINEMTITSEQLDRYKRMKRLPSRISAMTKEYEYSLISDRPPHFLVNLLGQSAQTTPDPAWHERWERWDQLVAQLGGNAQPFGKATASKFIAQWNEEPEENGAEAPFGKSLETKSELNH